MQSCVGKERKRKKVGQKEGSERERASMKKKRREWEKEREI